MTVLSNGDLFPNLSVPAVGGGTLIDLPEVLTGSYGVVLIYRGSWCPYCNAQLASFSRATDELTARDAQVVALSVDGEATSADLAEKHRIAFPLGHSADADKVAEATGAFTNDDPTYLQSTGFVLGPDGRILTAVYSSGAIGRLAPDDVIGFIDHAKSQA
jgi:peroxiredoxin